MWHFEASIWLAKILNMEMCTCGKYLIYTGWWDDCYFTINIVKMDVIIQLINVHYLINFVINSKPYIPPNVSPFLSEAHCGASLNGWVDRHDTLNGFCKYSATRWKWSLIRNEMMFWMMLQSLLRNKQNLESFKMLPVIVEMAALSVFCRNSLAWQGFIKYWKFPEIMVRNSKHTMLQFGRSKNQSDCKCINSF